MAHFYDNSKLPPSFLKDIIEMHTLSQTLNAWPHLLLKKYAAAYCGVPDKQL